jgi:hypothetical protein
MSVRRLGGLLVGCVVSACNLSGGDSVDRYELVNVAASIDPPADGTIRLFDSGRIEWQRVYNGSDVTSLHVSSGKYRFHRDSLRVSWASESWYTLGLRRGDTLELTYSGAADESHREFYVRR